MPAVLDPAVCPRHWRAAQVCAAVQCACYEEGLRGFGVSDLRRGFVPNIESLLTQMTRLTIASYLKSSRVRWFEMQGPGPLA